MKRPERMSLEMFFSVAAFITSVIALILSFQANNLIAEQNEIARSANRPQVEFRNDDRTEFFYTMCLDPINSKQYVVSFRVNRSVTAYNAGGRATSLIANSASLEGVGFPVLNGRSWMEIGFGEQRILPPVELLSGEAEEWTFYRSWDIAYATEDEMRQVFASFAEKPLSVKWTFNFADGSIRDELIEYITEYRTLEDIEGAPNCDSVWRYS